MKKFKKIIRLIKFNRKARMIATFSVLAVILTTGITIPVICLSKDKAAPASTAGKASDSNNTYTTPSADDSADITGAADPVVDKEVTSFTPAKEIDLEPSSITVFVNREYSLPKDYKPENLVTPNIEFNIKSYDERTLMRKEAATAIEKLFAAAKKKGLQLVGVSGYRSYDRQYQIFTKNLATKGREHTLKYSAIPGTSEHQTGLVMDCSTKSMHYDLSDKFYDTPEGKWLAKNAYKYGFIIRYPKDKADITGYAYEPWHIRYVGRGLSYYLQENNLTLDEYYNYTPSADFDFEKVYADILNTKAPVVTKKATPVTTHTSTPTPTPTPTKAAENNTGNKGNDKNNNKPSTKPTATPVPTTAPVHTPTAAPSPNDNSGSDTTQSTTNNAGNDLDTSEDASE